MQSPELRTEIIHHLAEHIDRLGLRSPIVLILGVFSSMDFMNSQLALFMRPFFIGWKWEPYVEALTDEMSWQELRCFLDKETG